MMAQKHLHELLQEDQEPFELKNYIADRRCQLKGPSPNTQLQLKKRKPISQKSKFPSNFCQNACFFSFHDEPEPRKSPPFEFPSPVKSPCRSPNNMFPHLPARTAALLLEAALRIQKQKSQNKNSSVGLFGSIKKKLKHGIGTRKRESSSEGNTLSVRDNLRWDSKIKQVKEQMMRVKDKSAFKVRTNGRGSSAAWSESNKDNQSLDLDLDTSCSSQLSENFEKEVEFDCNEKENIDFASCEKHFCESPFSFVLQRSPSSGSRTPDFSSPATFPSRLTHSREDKESNHQEIEVLKKFQVGAEEKEGEEEEEEEKEQCSPVSVLDPPFEDNDEGNDDEDEDEDDDDHVDMECSYALVQRTKQQLLHKLHRFERLAELDPIKLEKRMLKQKDDENDYDIYELDGAEENEDYEIESSEGEKNIDEFVKEVSTKFSFNNVHQIPDAMKRLVIDIVTEEEKEDNCCVNREVIGKRVCRRLELRKENESNTIEMMVEEELRREVDDWNKYKEQVGETTTEIEIAILGLLIEELSEELGDFNKFVVI
ncbi:glutamic acid-rich protein-like [Mangifera indica]|uniref:glutamic acid-rich protein-like n=1 Tax=Mangifera indica TaxID=29780 RepID=UPI001CFBE1D5|nr:glutamic acid-rich protein-like [Mangifera indica]